MRRTVCLVAVALTLGAAGDTLNGNGISLFQGRYLSKLTAQQRGSSDPVRLLRR